MLGDGKILDKVQGKVNRSKVLDALRDQVDEAAQVPLHDEHGGALLRVERVSLDVELAEEVLGVDARDGHRVLRAPVGAGVLQPRRGGEVEGAVATDGHEGLAVVLGLLLVVGVVEHDLKENKV